MEFGTLTLIMLFDLIVFWKLVSLVYAKQWDVVSSKIIFSIITAMVCVSAVSFLSDNFEGKEKAMLLIFGSMFSLIIMLLNLWMFSLVRKMKYVEATIPLSAYQELKKYGGELKEDKMICLIPRKDIFDIDQFLVNAKESQKLLDEQKKLEQLESTKVEIEE